MRKKIYTFTFVLFVISTSLYLVWAIAANIQKEAFKQYLSEVWSIDLNDENILETKSTNINVLLNRVKLDKKKESRKKILFSAATSLGILIFGVLIF